MVEVSAVQALIAVVFCLAAKRLYTFIMRPYTDPLKKLPGPPSQHWYFGITPSKVMHTNMLMQWVTEQTDKYGRVWAGPQLGRIPVLFTADPVAVQHVMLSASPYYVKVKFIMRVLQTFFGKGLLAVEGEPHKRHRKVAFPAFTGRAVVDDMGPHILGIGDDLVARFQRKCNSKDGSDSEKGVAIDAYDDFTRAAFDTIGVVGFNHRFNALQDEPSELAKAFELIFERLTSRTKYSFYRLLCPPLEKIGHYLVNEQRTLDDARGVVDAQSRKLVATAKQTIEKENLDLRSLEGRDLLSLLVKSNLSPDTKPSERMSDEEVVSMVPTFLAAGHETTSTALAWAAYALVTGSGLEKQERLRSELLDADNDGWQHDYKKIDALPYLDAVCKEVLRLYSPVRITRRTCMRDDVIPLSSPVTLRDGTQTTQIAITKGSDVAIHVHYLNTDPSTWGKDALEFRPERFLDTSHPWSDGKGLPQAVIDSKLGWGHIATFTIGPRNCIGMRMAVAELKVLLAKAVSRFQFLPHEDTARVEYRNVVVARPVVPGHPGFCMPCRIKPVAS